MRWRWRSRRRGRWRRSRRCGSTPASPAWQAFFRGGFWDTSIQKGVLGFSTRDVSLVTCCRLCCFCCCFFAYFVKLSICKLLAIYLGLLSICILCFISLCGGLQRICTEFRISSCETGFHSYAKKTHAKNSWIIG